MLAKEDTSEMQRMLLVEVSDKNLFNTERAIRQTSEENFPLLELLGGNFCTQSVLMNDRHSYVKGIQILEVRVTNNVLL